MKDLTDQVFGRLTATSPSHKTKRRQWHWNCICGCGASCIAASTNLGSGATKSCGCLNKEVATARATTHGRTGTPIYHTWVSMRDRCNNSNNKRYPAYGGRGITVCERWSSFENFYEDMGERPKGKTLDRKDNNGNYEKDNCRWATKVEQSRNQRTNKMLSYKGKTQCLAAWCEELELPYNRTKLRLTRYNWSVEGAFDYL